MATTPDVTTIAVIAGLAGAVAAPLIKLVSDRWVNKNDSIKVTLEREKAAHTEGLDWAKQAADYAKICREQDDKIEAIRKEFRAESERLINERAADRAAALTERLTLTEQIAAMKEQVRANQSEIAELRREKDVDKKRIKSLEEENQLLRTDVTRLTAELAQVRLAAELAERKLQAKESQENKI